VLIRMRRKSGYRLTGNREAAGDPGAGSRRSGMSEYSSDLDMNHSR